MAQLNFSDLMSSGGSDKNRVGFFSLRDDGNEAIVRIMHDSVESLLSEAFSIHTIELNGKLRKINCVKGAQEASSACPLCAGNYPIQNRVFVRLIEYTKDDRGNILASPKIWERPAKMQIPELASYIDEYGPLSQRMFKIIRHGAPKATDTKYQFLPLDSAKYSVDKFPLTDAFNEYKVLGGLVLDKTPDEISTYLATGNFPAKEGNDNFQMPSGTPYASSSQPFAPSSDPVDDFPIRAQASPATSSFDFSNAQGITKPTRFY